VAKVKKPQGPLWRTDARCKTVQNFSND